MPSVSSLPSVRSCQDPKDVFYEPPRTPERVNRQPDPVVSPVSTFSDGPIPVYVQEYRVPFSEDRRTIFPEVVVDQAHPHQQHGFIPAASPPLSGHGPALNHRHFSVSTAQTRRHSTNSNTGGSPRRGRPMLPPIPMIESNPMLGLDTHPDAPATPAYSTWREKSTNRGPRSRRMMLDRLDGDSEGNKDAEIEKQRRRVRHLVFWLVLAWLKIAGLAGILGAALAGKMGSLCQH